MHTLLSIRFAFVAAVGSAMLVSPAWGQSAAGVSSQAGSTSPDARFDGRLDLSHSFAFDDATGRQLSFSDVRLTATGTHLSGGALGLHVDGRARNSWNDNADNRVGVSEAYLSLDSSSTKLRLTLGRQLIRPIAAAEVDGVRVDRYWGQSSSVFAFGGLVPNPITGEFGTALAGAGVGYEHRGPRANHAGGIYGSWYEGGTDRVYFAQRSYRNFGRSLNLSASGIIDVRSTESAGAASQVVDVTSLSGMGRYRPNPKLDLAVTANHFHTVIPGKWWADWLVERRRAAGFVLDGEEPVGTRVTSLRWTTNLHISRGVIPYSQLRFDERHSEDTRGYQARAGLKLRSARRFLDANYSYRAYARGITHVAGLTLGHESERWGVELGSIALQNVAAASAGGQVASALNVNAMCWRVIGLDLGLGRRLLVVGQYQGLYEPEIDLHAFYLQLGYRL